MAPSANNQTHRIVAYNILEGLRPVGLEVRHPPGPAGEDRRRVDRDRAALAQQVVRELAPDILVLNEALFCRIYDGHAVDYGALFGFPHHVGALYDEAWGNAILSRHPIVASREMRIYNRGGVVADIELPGGQLTVASYHPHPRRYPANKAADFADLVGDARGPTIVCGDFNGISPEDPVDRAALIEAFEAFADPADQAVDRFIDSGRHVFPALAEMGFRDAIPPAGRRYSMPTDLANTDKRSAIRIDHILANEGVRTVAGKVAHSHASNRASDHHPVMLEFQLRAEVAS